MITVCSLAFGLIAPIVMYIYMLEKVSAIKSTVYVLDKNSNISDATAKYENEVRIYEYEDVVKDVFTWWYEFDERSYQRNIDKALLIFDEIGKNLKDDYDSQGLLTALKDKNLATQLDIEEPVLIDMESYPVVGRIKGVQKWIRGDNVIKLDLTIDFELKDVKRGKGNPHGVKITKWDVKRMEMNEK